MLSEGLLATLVTGTVGIAGIIVSRFKCVTEFNGCCRIKSCRFGFMDASIVEDHEVQFKKISLNGTEVLHKCKDNVQIDEDTSSSSSSSSPPDPSALAMEL